MKKILQNMLFQIITFNVLVLIIANILIYNIMEKFILDELRSEFEKKVALARPQIDLNALEREDEAELKAFVDHMKMLTQLRITILNRLGKVLADSDVPSENLDKVDNHLSREEIQEALMRGAGIASRKSKTINEELIYYSETIRKSRKIIGFFRTAIFMPDVNAKFSFIKSLLFKVDLIFIFMIFITLILVFFRNRRRFAQIRRELSLQRENNRIIAVSYQDDHEINKLLREINKNLTWSQNTVLENQRHGDRLKNILNSIVTGVMTFSQRGQIIFANDAFRKIFKIEEQNLENQEIYNWIHFPPVISDIENFLRDRTLPEIFGTIKYYDDCYIEYRIFRQNIGEYEDLAYIFTVRDITRLQHLETIRRDFVANVSHEFKTPLSSIRGYAETLLSGAADDEDTRVKFLKKIERQTIRLEHLVSDILQLAKIEKKDISDMTRIDILVMLREIIEEFNPLVRESDLSIEFDPVKVDSENQIEANPDMVRTIIVNLLSNAIQYNRPKGQVKIRLNIEKIYCVIEVEDTGIGISKDEINRIFERFFRTNEARSIFSEGTGLGLSIVKNAVDSLGGQVNVESKPGNGTIFIIKLPLTKKNEKK
jgi:two-component system phosphate regulon sensor histidine kinase PhoR